MVVKREIPSPYRESNPDVQPVAYSQFYHPFYKQVTNTFLPLLWQYFLILKRINKFVDLRM